ATTPSGDGTGSSGGIPWYFGEFKEDVNWSSRGAGVSTPNPYVPGAASSTVKISETTTASSTVTGTTTLSGGANSTSSSFSNSTVYDDMAYFESESPAGFTGYQPNTSGALQDGWAQFDETDTSSGNDVYGAVTASFTNKASETTTATYFNTTNTTPGSWGPLYQEWTSRSMSTSTSETGGYTTNAPGGPMISPTPNNPGGYATFNETRDDQSSVTNSATITWANTATNNGTTESASMTYDGNADSSYTSHKVTAAGPGDTAGTVSGSYTATGAKTEGSTIHREGSWGGSTSGGSYVFDDSLDNDKTVRDVGTYPAGGVQTDAWATSTATKETDTVWYVSPSSAFGYTHTWSGGGSSGDSNTNPDGLAQSQADPGPSPPAEAEDVAPLVQVAPYTITSNDIGGSAWDNYWSNVLRTAQGYFYNGPKKLVMGLYNTVRHPIDSTIGVANAIAHPIVTTQALAAHYQQLSQTAEGQGEIGFDLASLLTPAGLAKLDKLRKAGQIGRVAAGIEGGLRTGAFMEGAAGGEGLGVFAAGRQLTVTEQGLAMLERHLANPFFDQVPYNAAMIARLRNALAAGQRISGADGIFYTHELYEATRMQKLLQAGKSLEEAYDIAHAAALRRYGVSPFSVYHPEVISQFSEWFGPGWSKFWGFLGS
ncbi:MAG: hypothetical protein ACREJM_02805, partial [Candidatus Saccharimonadales bacterium]